MSEEKPRIPPKIQEIAKIVSAEPDASGREIAARTGISKSEVARILAKPITRAEVTKRLAADGTGGAVRTIGQIIAALSELTDNMLDQGLAEDADITKFLQLLQALTATAERLARAGIDLTAVVDPADDTALRAELARAWRRGMRAALRWPNAARKRLDPHAAERSG
jgi:hypothetical protein